MVYIIHEFGPDYDIDRKLIGGIYLNTEGYTQRVCPEGAYINTTVAYDVFLIQNFHPIF